MEVIELRNPRALLIPQIQALLKAAVESETLMTTFPWDDLAEDMLSFVTEPRQFMLIGAEKGEFRSVILGYEPSNRLFPYPTVIMFYNKGSRALFNAMKKKLLDSMVEKGYTRLMAVNGTKRDDAPYLRLMLQPGVSGHRVGSLLIFEVK